MLLPDSIDELIVAVEGKFDSGVGPPRAYFEWEDAKQQVQRGIYEVMSIGFIIQGQDPKERDLTKNLIHLAWETFEKIAVAGATRIVWRNGTRIRLEREHVCRHEGDLVRLYTRFAALNPAGEQIHIPAMTQPPDGEPTILITRELLEDIG